MATVDFGKVAQASGGAVAYACTRLGLRVFPLRSDTGTPVFTGWPERATRDEAMIRRWWTGDYATCGVGIATGPESGVWVLDVDVKEANGYASLRQLCADHDTGVDAFQRTMVVRTPSGGAHVYFRWDAAADTEGGVRNDSSGKLGPSLDVRGVRGYVRAPGVGGYAVVERGGAQRCDIVSAPTWLTELCKKRRVSGFEADTNADIRARLGSRGRQWARFEAAEALRKLERAEAGTRNDALNRTAFRLGVCGALAEREAWHACQTVMRAIGANDSEAQQLRTFRSGWEAGTTAVSIGANANK